MSSVNKVILIGNVGNDPEVRYLDRGIAIANFNLATSERGYTMQNGTQVPDKTEWHSIVLWRNLAEWWEKDGQVRRKTEVVAENIQILYRPEEYRNMNASRDAEQPVTETEVPENLTLEENDIF